MNSTKRKEEKIFSGVMRLNAKILGLALGLLAGLILFIATNWLVIMGGVQHLVVRLLLVLIWASWVISSSGTGFPSREVSLVSVMALH